MNAGHLAGQVLGTGIWRYIRLIVIIFTASAVIRLVPLPRQDATDPARSARRVRVTATAAGLAVVVIVAGVAYTVAEEPSTAENWPVTAARTLEADVAVVSLRPGSGVFVAGDTTSWRPVAAWSALTDVRPGLVTYYSGWGDPFQSRFARWAHAHGAVPFVQMEPARVSLASIAAGRWDAYLRAWAGAVRAYGFMVAVSFGPEANGPFYSWGCGHSPARHFVAAWRHIHDVMTAAGATNIIWTWDVNRIYYATCPLAARWPGAAYVDWIGVDGYWRGPGDTYASALAPTVRAVRRLADKPVLIAETGAKRGPAAAGWVRSIFAGARADNLIAVVWFNYRDRLGDYRLQDGPATLAAFRAAAAGARLGGPANRVSGQRGAAAPDQGRATAGDAARRHGDHGRPGQQEGDDHPYRRGGLRA